MEMQNRLANMRDAFRVSQRLTFKKKILEERRRLMIQNMPQGNGTMNYATDIPNSEQVAIMVESGDIVSLSNILKAPIEQVKDLLLVHSKDILRLAKNNLMTENRMTSICVIGSICNSDFMDSSIIDDIVIF
jgi:hypothetical protein